MARMYVEFDETGIIRTLMDGPLHNACPVCHWHHGQHAPWCKDPQPYECIPGCEIGPVPMWCRKCGEPVTEMVGSVPPGGVAKNKPCGHRAGTTSEFPSEDGGR